MTENEAIRDLQYLIGEYSAYPPETGVNATVGSLQYCITALKEIQQYREIGSVEQVKNQKENLSVAYRIISDYESIGTVEECRKAVEKQKAKKPEVIDQDFDYYKCPVCGEYIWATDNINDHKYCLNCGQAVTL